MKLNIRFFYLIIFVISLLSSEYVFSVDLLVGNGEDIQISGSSNYGKVYIGTSSGDTSSITVLNSGSLNVSSTLYAGVSGTGSLIIDGGTVSPHVLTIGNSSGSVGMVIVTNNGILTSIQNLNLGSSGYGEIDMSSGSMYVNGDFVLGANSGSTGFLNLSGNSYVTGVGGGYPWVTAYLGQGGSGTITINDSSSLYIPNHYASPIPGVLRLGANAGSSGTLNFGTDGLAGSLSVAVIDGGSGSATINFFQSNNLSISSDITGSIGLNQLGTGTTTLSGDNSYTNATLINAGTLLAASTNAFGSSVVTLTNSGSIALSTNLTISSLVWSGASSSVAISNLSSGAYLNITGALNLTGTGTFNLTGDTLGSSPLELMAWGSGSYTTNNFAITGQSGYVLSISNDALYIATAPVPSNILYVGSNSSSQTTNFTSGTNIYTGVYVGYSAAALSNKLVVSGNSTLLTNSGDTYIGYDGHNNSMVISNGGTVVNSNGWIGYGSTASNNIVTVNGGTWSNSGNLYVGLDGASNSLVITNGGTVQSAAVFVGHYATAVGNLLAVSGTQSTLNVSGDLYVGYAGQSNRMVISSGGFVSDVNGFDDGVSPSDSHNSVLVTGSGSVWTNSGNLTFGLAGHDNSLVISNSGFVAVGGESIIGNQSTASNNSVLVTGAGSLWTNSQDLTIGSDGSGNSLSILNGGSVSVLGNTNGVAIGLNADSSNNSVTVSGASTLTSGQNVYVGVYGSGNSLIVSNNAKVNLSNSGTLQLGYDSNSINNSVLVTSNGTINDYDVYLGSSTSGTNRQNNYLVVFRGGALNSGDEIDVYSGSILVTEGGVMSATNDINIGWGSSSSNSLVVSNTGVVNCSSFTVGSYATSSNNFVIVTGTNSKIINTGDFLMNYGNASVNNSMVISNGGVVSDVNATLYGNTNSSSYGTFDSVYIKGAGSAWSNSTLTIGGGGSAYVTVCDGATLAASNGITLNSTNGLDFLIIGDYTLASGTFNPIYNSNGTGGSIIAPSITFTNGVLGAPFEGAAIGFAQAGLCTLTSSVSGYGQIVQLGMGTSVISGNNGSFSGLTVIQSGTLQAASTNALGTSGVQLSGGTLSLATNLTINSLSWDTGAIVQLATNGVFLNVTNGVSLTGSGTNNFDFLGYFSSSSNSPTELMAFGSSSLSTTNFGIDDVTGYTLFTSNNALWVYGGTFNGGGGGGLIASNTGTTISITQTNASVTFQTNGILTITPTGNLTITTNVVVNNNGTVNLNGQFTTPNLTIQSGSTLSGNGGTLNGNLTLQKGSAFVVQSGQSPITVNGTATLGGTLEIATPMAFGTKQTFLSATSITGTFDSIIAPAGERARLVIEGDPTVSVIMAPVSYTQMAANQNQVNVATALNSFIPYTSSDRLVISTSLDSLTASQYNQAFNAIMPTFYQQVATIAFNEANALTWNSTNASGDSAWQKEGDLA